MEEQNLLERFNPMAFQVNIEKFVEQANNDLLTLYTIKVQHLEAVTWRLVRSFNEFETLHRKFVKLFKEVPILPSRSFFAMSDQEQQSRMFQLESYLNVAFG